MSSRAAQMLSTYVAQVPSTRLGGAQAQWLQKAQADPLTMCLRLVACADTCASSSHVTRGCGCISLLCVSAAATRVVHRFSSAGFNSSSAERNFNPNSGCAQARMQPPLRADSAVQLRIEFCVSAASNQVLHEF